MSMGPEVELYGISTITFTWTKNRIDFCKISLRSSTRFRTRSNLGIKADMVHSLGCAMKGLLRGSERHGTSTVQNV